ncbi:translation initiation factor eIF4e [Amniculicola lignicola CBS 123094]|uniref:Translation initiation factor eIF4e n=1 Tax=Amniculicola lignicola CBS 123094 TaxID=1392246 RepID=A0A6A5W700_9PLEO|nr:translation initiation factor eIF4e [Amniculicola lignicola CBS 123094]
MAEIQRLIGMLQASAAQLPEYSFGKNFNRSSSPLTSIVEKPERASPESNNPSSGAPVPTSLLEAFELVFEGGRLPPPPATPLSKDFQTGLNHFLSTLNAIFPPSATRPSPPQQVRQITTDVTNDLAIATSKRIFAASKDPSELQTIATEFRISPPKSIMAGRFPVLSTSNLPSASAAEAENTASPARGTAMLNSIFKSVRVPEFRFRWQFWAEKGQQSSATKPSAADEYASRPKPLGEQIISIKEFYQHFNNIPIDSLKLRDSIHLFHLGVKPLWEDPRNTRGGAYYFRVSRESAAQVWHEMCLLAVGDVLQGAVETKRDSFNDDICGISYSVRWNAVQIAVWNRDADNEAGKEMLLQTILDKLSEEIKPKKDAYWYKAHKEHKGFITENS